MYFQGRMQDAYVVPRGGQQKMARRILLIAVIVIVAGFLYLGYTSYDAGRAVSNGTVYSNDTQSAKRKSESPSADSHDDKTSGQTVVYPTPSSSSTQASAVGVPSDQTTQPGTTGGGTQASGAPASDSISPNPPNGMTFSGTGRYQLYRQGDITWRLDTNTGQSCVIFATDEQWKKPRVFRAGCGKT
jgi:hypothetical protein